LGQRDEFLRFRHLDREGFFDETMEPFLKPCPRDLIMGRRRGHDGQGLYVGRKFVGGFESGRVILVGELLGPVKIEVGDPH